MAYVESFEKDSVCQWAAELDTPAASAAGGNHHIKTDIGAHRNISSQH
jgi:hypothetical protein